MKSNLLCIRIVTLLPIVLGTGSIHASGQENGMAFLSSSANNEDFIVELEPLVVTGTATPLPAFLAASDITFLAGDEKGYRQTASLGTTLDHLPGIATVNTGSGVGLPVIRGLSGNRIRVLQDGIGVNYQQFGVRHPPNIDPFLLERVEVVRGVSSILYGSDAFGGAINAMSPEIRFADSGEPEAKGSATYRYESGNRVNTGALDFAFGNQRFGIVGGLVRRDAGNLHVPETETWNGQSPSGQPSDVPRFDGELDFTDYEQWNGFVKGGYRIGPSEFTLRYERWDHENNYLLPSGGGIGVDLVNNQIHAEGAGTFGDDWTWKASYQWNENFRQANPGGQPLPVVSPDVILERDSHTFRAEFMRGDWEDRLSGAFGFEGLHEDQESRGPTGLSPGGQVENLAVFGLARFFSNPWTFEAGLRFDHRSQEADPSRTADPGLLENRRDPISGNPVIVALETEFNIVTASLGALFQASDTLVFAANLNRGFRAPTLFELYASGVHGGVAAFQFGEANLQEETSLGADFQVRWRGKKVNWTATTYVTDFSDYIFLVDTGATHAGSGLPVFKVDQGDALLYGGDLSASWHITEWMTLRGTYEAVRGEFDDNSDVPMLPADQIQLELKLQRKGLGQLENPEFRIGIRHAFSKDSAGPREPFSQFDRNPNFGTASTDTYTLLDMGLGFAIGRFRFDVELKNATDEAYRDFLDTYKGYALSPGRSISVQATLAF
ncbi:MAG: TonB-dependent receptor [Oceanipulchritudo sp.]